MNIYLFNATLPPSFLSSDGMVLILSSRECIICLFTNLEAISESTENCSSHVKRGMNQMNFFSFSDMLSLEEVR